MIGNLANDPESRTTASGVSMCQFRLAVQRRFANQQGGARGRFLQHCRLEAVGGALRPLSLQGPQDRGGGQHPERSYDAQDGSKRYITEIIADNVEFLSSSQGDRQQRADNPPPPSEPSGYSSDPDAFTDVDDELPF